MHGSMTAFSAASHFWKSSRGGVYLFEVSFLSFCPIVWIWGHSMVKIWTLPWEFFQLQGHRRETSSPLCLVVWWDGWICCWYAEQKGIYDDVFVWGGVQEDLSCFLWLLSLCNSRVVCKPLNGEKALSIAAGWITWSFHAFNMRSSSLSAIPFENKS